MDKDTPDADQLAGYLITQGLADNTVRNYRSLYQRWLDWCATEGSDPAAMHPADVRGWSRTLQGTRSTLAQGRALVGHLCRMLDVPDASAAIPLPRKPRQATRGLSAENAGKLVRQAKLSGIAGTAVLIGLYTAARRSEIAGMRWEHVGVEDLVWSRPKVRDWHRVPLHPVLAEHLHARKGSGEEWLFPGRWGGHVSPAQVGRWTEQVAEAAGVGHVTPHQLRHTALTLANDSTRDLRAVMDLAGHTKPEVTAAYTRVGFERLAETVAALNYDTEGTA